MIVKKIYVKPLLKDLGFIRDFTHSGLEDF